MKENALIIFIKNPVLGKVKTRLAKTMGNGRALEVYKELLGYTRIVAKSVNAVRFVYYSNFIDEEDKWDREHFVNRVQTGKNLGERMLNAFDDVFDLGFKNACIIGSDCLEISKHLIEQSFMFLNEADVVIGPANDGGYYLLAMNELQPFLFENKDWSTPNVMQQTKEDLQQHQKKFYLLQQLIDIDTEEDYNQLMRP